MGNQTAAAITGRATTQRQTKRRQDDLAVEQLRDFDGAASFLCTSPRHVRRLWQERRLAGVKVGRAVRFTEADLLAYIERHRVESVR